MMSSAANKVANPNQMAFRGDVLMLVSAWLVTAAAALSLSACQRESEASPPEIRPVRTVTVAKRDVGEVITFTGRIEAENETRLHSGSAGG